MLPVSEVDWKATKPFEELHFFFFFFPNSQRPHGPQPTRLLRPWDFPGKSTGVGCHCLLQELHFCPMSSLGIKSSRFWKSPKYFKLASSDFNEKGAVKGT